jgi:GT2 family glycosyltransferase
MVPPDAARAFATHVSPNTGFALMGGRVIYLETPDRIQIDGGTLNRWTGVTGNLNLGAQHSSTPPPNPAQMDFVTGASMVASRAFYEIAGPMPEDYFLYYEEVDWALRRGTLPLDYCAGGIVYHRAGTAIGSPTLGRPASPFSLYFKNRGRLRFMRRYFPAALPAALLYSTAKAVQLLVKGFAREAATLLGASLGLGPSKEIRDRLSPAAQKRAF